MKLPNFIKKAELTPKGADLKLVKAVKPLNLRNTIVHGPSLRSDRKSGADAGTTSEIS